ncbi:MAG: ISSpo2 transposase [Rhodospirillaceae bacterium]|nr:MAG: ISSpo2 transposase [Rhodospirillaceae bacterium]
MYSSVSPPHGEQEGTAYKGHFAGTCYHRLFVFAQFRDLERSAPAEKILRLIDELRRRPPRHRTERGDGRTVAARLWLSRNRAQ